MAILELVFFSVEVRLFSRVRLLMLMLVSYYPIVVGYVLMTKDNAGFTISDFVGFALTTKSFVHFQFLVFFICVTGLPW